MIERTRRHIRRIALETPQLEACGVIVADRRRQKVIRCRNLAPDPAHRFILSPEDFAAAGKTGNVIAVWHSHPNGPLAATVADRSACEASGLPWHIYSVPADNFVTIVPSGFRAPLIGREFVWGVHDCGTLVADYYREVLGIELHVEPYPDSGFWKDPCQKPYLQKFYDNGFESIATEPRIHDCLLMQLSADEPNHAAIIIDGGMILHHVQGRLSCRDIYGGYWRQITRHILRHRNLL